MLMMLMGMSLAMTDGEGVEKDIKPVSLAYNEWGRQNRRSVGNYNRGERGIKDQSGNVWVFKKNSDPTFQMF